MLSLPNAGSVSGYVIMCDLFESGWISSVLYGHVRASMRTALVAYSALFCFLPSLTGCALPEAWIGMVAGTAFQCAIRC